MPYGAGPAGSLPPRPALPPAVRALACGRDEPDRDDGHTDVGIAAEIPSSRTRWRSTLTNRSSSPSTSACAAPGFGDHRRDVDAGVIRVGQQQRRHHRLGSDSCHYVAQIRGRRLLAKRHAHLEPGALPTDLVRDSTRVRRGARIGAAVGGQNEVSHRNATRIPSCRALPAAAARIGALDRPGRCTARSRSTDSPRTQGD